MIGKAPSTGSSFKGLVSYLMRGKVQDPNPERVAWHATHNLAVDDPLLATRIMRATAGRSVRCPKPVYHLVVSWHETERPSDDAMRLVGETMLTDLSLSDHQALMVAHADTTHRHLHIVVNRVHPDTGKAWDRWQDWPRIERSLGRQAQALGFQFVPGRHNAKDAFKGTAKNASDPDYQRARRTGQLPADARRTPEQIASCRARLAETISRAHGWDELGRALSMEGIRMYRKGQGLVLADAGGAIKLSDLGRNIRLPKLQERFGEDFAAYDDRRVALARQEAMSRAERLAAHLPRPVSRPAPPVAADDGDQASPPERALSPVFDLLSPGKTAEPSLEEALTRARAEVDLAYRLFGAGLLTREQLDRSLKERQRLQDRLAGNAISGELFGPDDIGNKSRRMTRPKPKGRGR